MKRKKFGFTLAELLVVVAVIAILVGVLVPALTMVRRIARETRQRAQLTTIDLALTAFRNDSGYSDYPPSFQQDEAGQEYGGAQRLAEALLGCDLLGFHPMSTWGADCNAYEPPTPSEDNLNDRSGPYLELGTATAFRLGDLFDSTALSDAGLDGDRFVICDSFGVARVILANGDIVRAGTPILYYRANTAMVTMESGTWSENIYNFEDNMVLVDQGQIRGGAPHQLSNPNVFYSS
ncbi:MAG: type II secretion system protein, partial [Planctomycetota bacterium]